MIVMTITPDKEDFSFNTFSSPQEADQCDRLIRRALGVAEMDQIVIIGDKLDKILKDPAIGFPPLPYIKGNYLASLLPATTNTMKATFKMQLMLRNLTFDETNKQQHLMYMTYICGECIKWINNHNVIVY